MRKSNNSTICEYFDRILALNDFFLNFPTKGGKEDATKHSDEAILDILVCGIPKTLHK